MAAIPDEALPQRIVPVKDILPLVGLMEARRHDLEAQGENYVTVGQMRTIAFEAGVESWTAIDEILEGYLSINKEEPIKPNTLNSTHQQVADTLEAQLVKLHESLPAQYRAAPRTRLATPLDNNILGFEYAITKSQDHLTIEVRKSRENEIAADGSSEIPFFRVYVSPIRRKSVTYKNEHEEQKRKYSIKQRLIFGLKAAFGGPEALRTYIPEETPQLEVKVGQSERKYNIGGGMGTTGYPTMRGFVDKLLYDEEHSALAITALRGMMTTIGSDYENRVEKTKTIVDK
jgi:hypothetical protein